MTNKLLYGIMNKSLLEIAILIIWHMICLIILKKGMKIDED